MCKYSELLVALVQKWEGLVDGDPSTPGLEPYVCPAGYWTIGWGHVLWYKGKKLHSSRREWLRLSRRNATVNEMIEVLGEEAKIAFSIHPEGITLDEAEDLLRMDLDRFETQVNAILDGSPTKQGQFDAFVSFAFNLGAENLDKSTLMRMHKGMKRVGVLRSRSEALLAAELRTIQKNAPDQFMVWNKFRQGGVLKFSNGLAKRRWEEREMYLS